MITKRMMRRERETARTTTGKSREIIARVFRRRRRSILPPSVFGGLRSVPHLSLGPSFLLWEE